MTVSRYGVFLTGALCLFCLSCDSLINETDRIRKAYALKNPLTVIATDPVDNAFAPYNQSYIDVTFSSAIDPNTFTAQSTFGACSGSFRVSYDLFNNCLGGTVDSSANPRIRFTPTIFPKALGLQVRVTNAVISAVDVPATPYTSPVGFRLAGPCGNFNCFFSYSTPLMMNAGTSSGVFLIRAGTNTGKYLVYTQGQATTTLIDPVAVTSSSGPSFAGSCDGAPDHSPAQATYDFLNFAKTKQIILTGGGSNRACVFDHATNTFSKIFISGLSGLGGHAFVANTSSEVNNTLLVNAHNNTGVGRYNTADATSGTVFNVPFGVNIGGHSIRVNSTAYPNCFLLFTNRPNAYIFSEGTPGWSTGYTIPIDGSNGVGDGASSFEVSTGMRQGQLVTVRGGNRASLYAYDIVNDLVPTQPANLTASVNAGGMMLRQSGTITYDQPVITHGSGSTFNTSTYNPTTGDFDFGPITTGAIAAGAAQVYIPGGSYGGAFFIVNGAAGTSTSVYIPATSTFHGSRLPGNVPNLGVSSFAISGGTNNGRTMIVSGNASRVTAVFDPLKFEMTAGPILPAAPALTATSFAVPLTRGTSAGKVVLFVAGGTSSYMTYDPASNAFSVPGSPLAFGNIGVGATAFPVINTTNSDGRIIVVRGGSSNQADVVDQSTNSLLSALTIGCTVSGASLNLRYATSTGAVRQLIYCSGTQLAVFDHATASFLAPVTVLAGGGGAGMQAFVVPNGPDMGKIVIIYGGGNTFTTVHDPDTLSATAGPALTVCTPGGGSQIFPITTGLNAGKTLLIAGNDTKNSCIFNTANNAVNMSLVSGPAISLTASTGFNITAGAIGFKTNGGLYPTAFVVLSGATKNVWSTYVP